MSGREFEALQNRWVAGDELLPEEERRRGELAADDPLARRELELFQELRGRLEEPDEGAPNVALALAGARGVKLRLLGPDSVEAKKTRGLGGRRVAVAAGLATLAAAGALYVARRDHAPAAPPLGTVAATPRAGAQVTAAVLARSELVFASGDVRVAGRSVSVGKETLGVGTHVETGAGQACLTIDPYVDVCLGADSAVVLESLEDRAVRVRVSRGTAVAALAARKAGHHFALAGGDVVATAHGTVFALDVKPNGAAPRVTVVEGEVAVRRGKGKTELVGAHFGLTPGEVGAGEREPVGRNDEARLYALLSPRELWQEKTLGVLEVGAAGPGERVLIDQHGPFELPLSVFVATGRHRVAVRAAHEPESTLDVEVDAGSSRRLAANELVPVGSSSSTPRTASALLDDARRKLAAGDSRAALALYRELRRSYPRSSEAATVLVTLGKLELDLGAPERAMAAFDAYVEHGGPLLPEALSGRIRALRALGKSAEERRAIEQYLGRFPTGFEAPSHKQRLATLGPG